MKTENLTLLEAAQAKLEGKRVEFLDGGKWFEWDATLWHWECPYRIAPEPKKMRKVKILAWFNGSQLFWYRETDKVSEYCKRVPAHDMEIEVEEV